MACWGVLRTLGAVAASMTFAGTMKYLRTRRTHPRMGLLSRLWRACKLVGLRQKAESTAVAGARCCLLTQVLSGLPAASSRHSRSSIEATQWQLLAVLVVAGSLRSVDWLHGRLLLWSAALSCA